MKHICFLLKKLANFASADCSKQASERMPNVNAHIRAQLEREILPLQGYKPAHHSPVLDVGLGPIRNAFPQAVFPLGAVHEFICEGDEGAAATIGFVSGIVAALMQRGGAVLWIGTACPVFPSALRAFGLRPEQVIFVALSREKDVLWAVEEALKCGSLAAVVGEVHHLDFTASRRLQLAVEKSKVTGFLFRHRLRSIDTTASLTRWKITPLATVLPEGMPGVGFPRWQVALLKVRNGRPGSWRVEWKDGAFRFVQPMAVVIDERKKRAG